MGCAAPIFAKICIPITISFIFIFLFFVFYSLNLLNSCFLLFFFFFRGIELNRLLLFLFFFGRMFIITSSRVGMVSCLAFNYFRLTTYTAQEVNGNILNQKKKLMAMAMAGENCKEITWESEASANLESFK